MENIVKKIEQLKMALNGIRSEIYRLKEAESAVGNQIAVLEQVLREEQGAKKGEQNDVP